MKNKIKKIGIFVLALAFMVSTASTVLAHGTGNEPGPGWDPPAPFSPPNHPGQG